MFQPLEEIARLSLFASKGACLLHLSLKVCTTFLFQLFDPGLESD